MIPRRLQYYISHRRSVVAIGVVNLFCYINVTGAQATLEEKYRKDMTLAEAELLALDILKQVLMHVCLSLCEQQQYITAYAMADIHLGCIAMLRLLSVLLVNVTVTSLLV